ncbi:MAG: hypothetical protein KatS3mg014_1747 [Actinomycetota bacterium]|nr:MAG: hypothetical protein KatS3mg014_1747 [Actinomycetota bacterium]
MRDVRLGYLSGGPRVSTLPDAEQAAARAHVLGVIRAFEELGWEVRRYIVGDHLRRGWVGAGSEATVSRNALTRLGADLTRMILGPVNARRAWRELGGSVDWVYERASLFARLGAPFSRRGIPWILETQSLRYRENPAVLRTSALASLGRRHEIAAYRRCDVVVAVSERLKDLIVSEANVDPGKVLVIRNAADADRFDPRRYPVRPPGDPPVIGFVGRLSAWQGLEELLECVALVSRSGIPFRLVVVGDGPLRGTLEQKARDLGLAGQVRFVGAVPWEETPRLIATFDLGFLGHRSIPGAGRLSLPAQALRVHGHGEARHRLADGGRPAARARGRDRVPVRSGRRRFARRRPARCLRRASEAAGHGASCAGCGARPSHVEGARGAAGRRGS